MELSDDGITDINFFENVGLPKNCFERYCKTIVKPLNRIKGILNKSKHKMIIDLIIMIIVLKY